MTKQSKAYVMKADEGQAFWFAGALMILKAAGDQTDGHFAFLDQHVPGDYAAPRHVHHTEDEAWYVLEGDVTFYCGNDTFTAGPGAWVFLPRDVPHAFKVGAKGGRLLTMSAPANFADFVRAAGKPAPQLVVPPPESPDIEHLASIAAKYGIEIVGPPPQ